MGFFDDDEKKDWDFIDFMNKTNLYEEDEIDEEQELEDELIMSGLDRDELEMMDEDERREALEDAGFDVDDFDF
jgi:hypothetical protein